MTKKKLRREFKVPRTTGRWRNVQSGQVDERVGYRRSMAAGSVLQTSSLNFNFRAKVSVLVKISKF